jgi:hypothetical protein
MCAVLDSIQIVDFLGAQYELALNLFQVKGAEFGGEVISQKEAADYRVDVLGRGFFGKRVRLEIVLNIGIFIECIHFFLGKSVPHYLPATLPGELDS